MILRTSFVSSLCVYVLIESHPSFLFFSLSLSDQKVFPFFLLLRHTHTHTYGKAIEGSSRPNSRPISYFVSCAELSFCFDFHIKIRRRTSCANLQCVTNIFSLFFLSIQVPSGSVVQSAFCINYTLQLLSLVPVFFVLFFFFFCVRRVCLTERNRASFPRYIKTWSKSQTCRQVVPLCAGRDVASMAIQPRKGCVQYASKR